MKKIVCSALAALSLTACASSNATYAHRLTAEQIAQMGPTPVSVTDNTLGITTTWPQSNAAGSSFIPTNAAGGLGLLLVMGAEAWANADPQRRANQTAEEFDAILPTEALNSALEQSFRSQITDPNDGFVTISGVSRSLKYVAPGAINDTIEVVLFYQASDYSNVLRITGLATYRDATGAQIYNNMFTYYSAEILPPALSPETTSTLLAAINQRALRPTGVLPTSGTTAGVDYIRDTREARDDFLTRAEKGILVTELWTRNDGALLRAEIANAQALITRYVLLDINRPFDPAAVPGEEIIETLPDGRTVHRIQTGFMIGTYEFRPAGSPSRAAFSNGMGISRDQYNFNRWYQENPPAPAS
jgi:hypothetical protein